MAVAIAQTCLKLLILAAHRNHPGTYNGPDAWLPPQTVRLHWYGCPGNGDFKSELFIVEYFWIYRKVEEGDRVSIDSSPSPPTC